MNRNVTDWLSRNWVALTALIISFLSATFGGINAYLNWRDKRRKVKVRLRRGQFLFGQFGKPRSDEVLAVDVKNKGCAVEIVDVVYQIDDKRYQEKRPD